MSKWFALAVFALIVGSVPAAAQAPPPLKPVARWALPGAPAGNFDHLAIDVTGHRLFATAEGGAVEVIDLRTGKLIHSITDLKKPHGILYRPDVNRLYVTDGIQGKLLIYDAKHYQQIGTVPLWIDADSVGYDPATHDLYIESGGGDIHQAFSHFTTVNLDSDKQVADMTVDGDTLEAMHLASTGPLIYFNVRSKNQVDLMDRNQHKILAAWPVHGATMNAPIALDTAHHRLFSGCRSGQMVVFDTATGKQILSYPIAKGADDMVYDKAHHRVYVAADGFTDVFEQITPDNYREVPIKTATMAKTALLVPSLHRYFVSVPKSATAGAEILVFQVN
ncbi:MAG TPA: hypothetical protein VNF74_08850 [Terriglobales bacterium]|nr:hypothetical protein [Terriglobales bacterium]